MDKFEKLSKNSHLITQLGVTQTEFKMYLQLLSIGPCTKTDFANRFKVPRTTVFANVERLIQKGLITQITRNNRNIVIAENPKKLEILALRRKIELEEELSVAKESGQELSSFIKTIANTIPKLEHESDTTVKYYVGTAGFRAVCQRALEVAEGSMLFVANIETWNKIYSEDDRNSDTAERIRRKVFLKALVVNNEEGIRFQEQDKSFFRETKFLPEQFNFKPIFIISGDEVSIINFNPAYLVTAIVMNDPDIAEFYKMLFAVYNNK